MTKSKKQEDKEYEEYLSFLKQDKYKKYKDWHDSYYSTDSVDYEAITEHLYKENKELRAKVKMLEHQLATLESREDSRYKVKKEI